MNFVSFRLGVYFTLSGYHLLVFMGRTKDRSNLAYSWLCLCMGLVSYFKYTYPNQPFYNENFKITAASWSLIFFSMALNFFTSILFDLRKIKVVSRSQYSIVSVSGIILTILYLYTKNISFIRLIYIIISAYGLFLFSAVFILVILKKRYRNRTEKIAIAGIFIFLVVGTIYLITNIFLQNSTYIFATIGYLCMAFLFAFALTDGFNREHRDLVRLKNSLEEEVSLRTKELAETNEKLKSLDKAKNIFFTNISHELRTPLSLIQAPVDAIVKGEYGKTINADNKIFKIINKNTQRLLNLINNLLDFSRIETGKMNLNKQKIDVLKALNAYVSEMESSFMTKKISLSFVSNTKEKVVTFLDKALFKTAVYNILSNAFKFTPEGGSVKMELDYNNRKKEYSITIKDTGIGIPKNKLDYIFERFHQVDESSDRKYEGTGIGLSYAKEIIELHGGRIVVESVLGEGASFIIKLPVCRKGSGRADKANRLMIKRASLDTDYYEENPSEDFVYDRKKKIVLIVEDNAGMRAFLESSLGKKYNVVTAVNGKDGLKKIKEIQKPDIIIADIMMPEMDGKEFFKRISFDVSYESIPFIFLTAVASQEEKIKGLKDGVVDYICKPFAIDELILKLDNILSREEKIEQALKEDIQKKLIEVINEEVKADDFLRQKRQMKYGEYGITTREAEIIELITEGLQDKEIGVRLSISTKTVSNHIQNIFNKIKVSNRIELVSNFLN